MASARRRIAHVAPSIHVIGGTEHGTVRLARAIEPAGFDSVMFCRDGDTPVSRFFRSEGFPVGGFSGVEPSLRRPLPYLRAVRALARDLREQRIDLMHCADLGAAHYTALAGRLAGVPVVCHVRSRHDAISRRDRIFLLPVNHWVFVSQDSWRRFSHRVPPKRGDVVYDGIDAPSMHGGEAATVRRELGIDDAASVIGMVARVSPQKDYLTLVRAARRIADTHPDARFLVVGDYEEHPQYRAHYAQVRAWLEEQRLSDRFLFTGFRRDVARLVAAMDVFVLCTHLEGLPLVLLEGMAQGKPVVATELDGIPEVVKDGETGLLHPHEDDAALARQISRLLDDPALARQLGAAGRRTVDTFWTNERFGRDMAQVYARLLDR